MRILFLSNFYPPARPGGYTQWCFEVAEGLKARGHQIGVLTSQHEMEKIGNPEENVWRLLHLEGDLNYYRPSHFFTRWSRELNENIKSLERVVKSFEPDILFVWGMWALSKRLPAQAERILPSRVVYYISDYWPSLTDINTAYWRLPARHWYLIPAKHILGKIALRLVAKDDNTDLEFEHAICVSQAVQDILVESGLPIQRARVIHGGTAIERFRKIDERDFGSGPLRLLYAGQLVSHKGVHTAIQALAGLVYEKGIDQIHLTIVGSGHPDYESSLQRMVERENLAEFVAFYGQATRTEMPSILEQHDVLVFPSVYDEPFARMTQEAMLAGLVVIGTTTGGTKEILSHDENGLMFNAEDSEDLARQIARLVFNRDLCYRLSKAGHQTVLQSFTLDKMVDRIERYLLSVILLPSAAETDTSEKNIAGTSVTIQ
jgi:glycogen(starch) synthase